MKKRAAACVLAALMLLGGVCAVCADDEPDMDYEGELDIESGKPVGEGGETDSKTRIRLSDVCVYDKETRLYCYRIGTTEVGMSLPSGVVTDAKVSLSLPDGITYRIHKNGEELSGVNPEAITDTGSYVVSFGGDLTDTLTFTIVGDYTNMTQYRLPAGFTAESVTVNAQDVNIRSGVIDMTKEGKYVIRYSCPRTGLAYTLQVTVDHTAPVLALEAVKDGYAKGPVDISDLEPGTAVSIYHNGDFMTYEKELTKSGAYKIVLQDKAQNRTVYEFRIRVYFNFNSVVFFILLFLVIAAVAVYIWLSCRRLKVR